MDALKLLSIAALMTCSNFVSALEPMFEKTVFLGHSIVQGVMSNSVESHRQRFAFPAILAKQMGTLYQDAPITYPGNGIQLEDHLKSLIPLYSYYLPMTVGGGRADLYKNHSRLTNYAINGATLGDLLDRMGSEQRDLYRYVLGSYTHLRNTFAGDPARTTQPKNGISEPCISSTCSPEQKASGNPAVHQALHQEPTFIVIWIGENEVKLASAHNDLRLMIPLETFTANLDRLTKKIIATQSVKGVAIATILDVTDSPFLIEQPDGSYENLLSNADQSLQDLSATNAKLIRDRTSLMNQAIRTIAAKNHWAVVETQAIKNKINEGYALINSEGIPGDIIINGEYLGGYLSLDGLHPTVIGHAVIANDFIRAINTHYQTQIPLVDEIESASKDTLYNTPVDPRPLLGIPE